MPRLSFFGWPETGLLSGGDIGRCPISRGHLRPQSFDHEPETGIISPDFAKLVNLWWFDTVASSKNPRPKAIIHTAAHPETTTPKAASPRGM
jgi:hypothetical protein